MGCCCPSRPLPYPILTYEKSQSKASRIGDNFATFAELSLALKASKLEACNLIVGIDFTASNKENGARTFGGRNLHAFPPPSYAVANDKVSHYLPAVAEGLDLYDPDVNPYCKAITFVGEALAPLDEDGWIPSFYFGDLTTKGTAVASFTPHDPRGCHGFPDLLRCYQDTIPHVVLSGPTTFEPLIEQALRIVTEKKDFHILLILGDGALTNPARDAAAIVRASHYPLSIIMVGVGDGPWDEMKHFDDELRGRKFDNFQLVIFDDLIRSDQVRNSPNPAVEFALHCLMEVPEQYQIIKRLGLLQL